MNDERRKIPFFGIVAWSAGVILWNIAGVTLIAQTGIGIRPTASLALAGIIAVTAVQLHLAGRSNGLIFAERSALFAACHSRLRQVSHELLPAVLGTNVSRIRILVVSVQSQEVLRSL